MSTGEPIVSGGLTPFVGGLSVASEGLLAQSPLSGLTPFEALEGLSQGRLEAEAGGASFFLGQSEEDHFADLAAGDFVEVYQDADLTAADLVRFDCSFRVPRSLPEGFAWRLALLLDGATKASVEGWPGYDRKTADLAINASKLSGVHRVALRLTLEAAP